MDKVKDLVCGMMIDPKTAAATSEYKGKTYYFCAKGCKDAFLADPTKYLNKTNAVVAVAGPNPGAGKAIDPVCGMEISPARAVGKSQHKGKTYYFCSEQCKRDFDKNPEAVLSKKAS